MKSLLVFLLVGATGAVGLSRAAAAPDAATADATEAVSANVTAHVSAADTVRLRIEGMTCGGCAISARVILRRLEGVERAEVRYEEKLAIVTYDPQKVTPERMVSALWDQLQYKAKVVDIDWDAT